MKSTWQVRILLIFMVVMIGSFDRHLSGYFTGEVNALIQAEAGSGQSDVPVKFCDHHEDISLRIPGNSVPVPDQFPVDCFQTFLVHAKGGAPHSVWQPPKRLG